ncbi:MAG: DUF3231 family protein [Selenomonadales bacterium]|nr:DUF3231 family protein [Selenomonadales bacterium]
MSIFERFNEETREFFQNIMDKEPLNYLEASGLYGVIAQGRYNVSVLETLYNHAQSPELKQLIKQAQDTLTKSLINKSEDLLQESGGKIPSVTFPRRTLHKTPLDIHPDARLTDAEVAIAVGSIAKASQLAMLAALHQSYQVEVALMYRRLLNDGLDWDYRLLQLMLKNGWLPKLHKVVN